MDKEDYTNRQGECPKCHGYNLDYEPIDFSDNSVFFRYKCGDCGQEGEEWYSLEFQGHNVYTEDGDKIEL